MLGLVRPAFPVPTPPPPPDREPPQSDSASHPPASLPDASDPNPLMYKPTEAAALGQPWSPGNVHASGLAAPVHGPGLFQSDSSPKATWGRLLRTTDLQLWGWLCPGLRGPHAAPQRPRVKAGLSPQESSETHQNRRAPGPPRPAPMPLCTCPGCRPSLFPAGFSRPARLSLASPRRLQPQAMKPQQERGPQQQGVRHGHCTTGPLVLVFRCLLGAGSWLPYFRCL